MVNEVVMYQSMFVLGILMFGFFATSFTNYTDFAEAITLDQNLERLLQEVSEELLALLERASGLKGTGGAIQIEIKLSLDTEYASESYIIAPLVGSSNNVSLVANASGDVVAYFPLPMQFGTDTNLGQISFSGSSASSSDDTRITYLYDSSTSLEQVVFS